MQRAQGRYVAGPPAGSRSKGRSAQLGSLPFSLCVCSAPKGLQVAGPDGEVYSLSRYYANWTLPRPESYTEDVQSAAGMSPDAQARLWRDLASGAESGGRGLLHTLCRAGDGVAEFANCAAWSAACMAPGQGALVLALAHIAVLRPQMVPCSCSRSSSMHEPQAPSAAVARTRWD